MHNRTSTIFIIYNYSYMMICYISGFLLLLLYVIYITIKDKGISESISATVYSLDDKSKWVYTIIIFIAAFLIAPHLFEITSAFSAEFLAFLTIIGMLGTGAAPLVHGKKNILHYSSAIIMGIASQIISYMLFPKIMFMWVPYIIYTLYMENGKYNMFIGELIMMISLLVCGIV